MSSPHGLNLNITIKYQQWHWYWFVLLKFSSSCWWKRMKDQETIRGEWRIRLRVLCMCCEWKSILRIVPLSRGHPILSDTDMIFCSSAIIPTTVNVQTWKNHYSYKKVVYLPDSQWLITAETVSIATSSLAAKGKWDFHPISFEMALLFSEGGGGGLLLTCWNKIFFFYFVKDQTQQTFNSL